MRIETIFLKKSVSLIHNVSTTSYKSRCKPFANICDILYVCDLKYVIVILPTDTKFEWNNHRKKTIVLIACISIYASAHFSYKNWGKLRKTGESGASVH